MKWTCNGKGGVDDPAADGALHGPTVYWLPGPIPRNIAEETFSAESFMA